MIWRRRSGRYFEEVDEVYDWFGAGGFGEE